MALGTSQNLFRFVGFTLNSTWIPAKDVDVDPGITAFLNGTGTSQYGTYGGLKTSKPAVTGSTLALKTLLDIVGVDPPAVGISAVVLYFARQASSGFSGSSNHVSLTINDGLACLESFGASGEDEADAQFKLYAIHDGTNAPLIFAGNVALPSPDALAETFFLGPIKVGSTLYECLNWRWQSNNKVKHDTHTGLIYPTYAGWQGGEPQLDLSTNDAGFLDLVDATGVLTGVNTTNMGFFLRKASQTTGRVADATEEHISLVVPAGFLHPGSQKGAFKADSTHAFMMKPILGGGDIATLDTTAAIS